MDELGRGDGWDSTHRALPVGRGGDGSDWGESVRFLVSKRGDWITGQAINVDGGHVWGT